MFGISHMQGIKFEGQSLRFIICKLTKKLVRHMFNMLHVRACKPLVTMNTLYVLILFLYCCELSSTLIMSSKL